MILPDRPAALWTPASFFAPSYTPHSPTTIADPSENSQGQNPGQDTFTQRPAPLKQAATNAEKIERRFTPENRETFHNEK